VNQPTDLLAHRRHDTRRAVAQQIAAPAGEEIKIAIARVVPDVRHQLRPAHDASGISGEVQ